MCSKRKVLAILFAYIFYLITDIKADTFSECENMDPDTYVASSESCSTYILCNDDDSVLFECKEGNYFDIESVSCDTKENVFCPLDSDDKEEIEGTSDNDGNRNEPNESEETKEVTTKEVTTKEITTKEVTTKEVLTTATTLSVSTFSLSVTSSSNPAVVLDKLPIVKKTCPAIDDPNQILYLPSSNSCSDYYVCYHGQPMKMHCSNYFQFNSLTGKCDFPENLDCKISNQQPLNTNKCLPHITDFFPHPKSCNYFYYCIRGYQQLQQCPFYYGWDIEKRTCVHLARAKCYESTI